MQRLTLLSVCVALAGCTMGPDYERPAAPEHESYLEPNPSGESVAYLPWWELYDDETLNGLIETALTQNKDLLASLARIAEARAIVGVASSDLYPQLGLIGAGSVGGVSSDGGPNDSTRSIAIGGGAFYQVDLWGRISRSREASLAGLLATEEAYRTVTITLVAEVARSYFILRDLDNRLSVSRATVETRQQSLDAMQTRFDAGAISEVDLNQAQVQLARADGTVQQFIRAVEKAENGISVLLGQAPVDVPRGTAIYEQVFPPEIPAGLPSELVQRRPDVLQAEMLLAAQTARIGIAEALRFPSLSLTANLGTQSTQLTDAVVGNSFIDVGFEILAPVFTGGRLKSNVEIERARTEALVRAYEQSILIAFREVEDALISTQTYREEYGAALREVTAAANAKDLAWIRYEDGLTSFLEYLQVERDLFSAELRRSETFQKQLTSVVDLYKALGGGWSVVEEPAEEPTGEPTGEADAEADGSTDPE